MKKTSELRKLDPKKLAEELEKTEKALFKSSFAVQNGQAKNSHTVHKERRQVARIKTIQKERELEAEMAKPEETNQTAA